MAELWKEQDAYVFEGRYSHGRRVRNSGRWQRGRCSAVTVIHQCDVCFEATAQTGELHTCENCTGPQSPPAS